MRQLALGFALALVTATAPALAQDAAAPPAPPAEGAPVDAPAAPVDPLKEPRDLVEVAANTKDNLKKAIALYEAKLGDASLPAKARADGYADLSRAYLRLGDLETAKKVKIDAYEKGRAAAQKGIALDARHADAMFWDMANLAVIGRTNGVMNSLFMLGDLRKGLGKVLAIDPRHSYAKQTLAEIDHAVPGIAGGSDERAEKAYLEIMQRDPYFTPTMVNLAEFYRDKDKEDEAKKWAKKVLETPRSSVPNDWRKFDKKEAQAVLKELEE
jgi:tetratricopeptide (TPR) repeat protein